MCDEASVDPTTTRVGTDIFYLIVTQHIYINFVEDCITLVCFNTMYVTLTTRQSVFVKQDMIYTIYPVGGGISDRSKNVLIISLKITTGR